MEQYFPTLVTGSNFFKNDLQRMLPELTSLLHLSIRHGSHVQQLHQNDAEHIRNSFPEHWEKSAAKCIAMYQFLHCMKREPL